MGLFNSLIGRRQFLIASMASVLALAFGKITKYFGVFSAMASEKEQGAEKKKLKAIVVYYSATGSTGKVAGAIYRGMKSVIKCDVAPVKKIDPEKIIKYDLVAIGGPVWYFRETANLRNFVNSMPRMDGKPCVLFCTHGTNPDGFFFSLNQVLQKKAFTVIGWDDWYGGCSHVLHQPSPYFTDGHPDEIDLQEAEAFGRSMAERAQRIYAGEKNLIPEIPNAPDAESLWVPQGFGVGGGMGGGPGGGMPGVMQGARMPGAGAVAGAVAGAAFTGGPPSGMPNAGMIGETSGGRGGSPGGGRGRPGNAEAANMIPTIDLAKCIYPRCRACIDVCVVDAINLSLAVTATPVSGSEFLVKEACLHCSHPLCERGCSYDAITFDNGTKTEHVFDMEKCTYPKCTLCVDNCPMESIVFAQDPPYTPHIKRNCEGCDVCWCVCPEDAISIPNIDTTHALLKPSGPDDGFFAALNAAEKAGKFRRLVPLDEIGWDNIVYMNPNAPRVVLKAENYPYEVNG